MAEIKVRDLSATATQSNLKIESLDDIKKLDLNQLMSIDPERMDLGTGMQDCAMIAKMYERGAHYTPTEAAVFAPLQRSVSNAKILSKKMAQTMQRYLNAPEQSPADQSKELIASAAEQGLDLNDSGGGAATDQSQLQNLRVGDEDQPTQGDNFGDKLLSWAKDCIPCLERPDGWLQMQPNLDLLNTMEVSLRGSLGNLMRIGSMLKNFDLFGDLCALLNMFDFICIPDLQRILAAIMAFLAFEIPSFEGLLNFIQALICPIFAPILAGLSGLLDQFVLLVTNPLTCIIDAINAQLSKLKFDTPPEGPLQAQQKPFAAVAEGLNVAANEAQKVVDDIDEFNQGLNDSLRTVAQLITNIRNKIQEQVELLIGELKALFGEFTLNDTAYALKAASKLGITRLISLILAIINAKSKGASICSGNNVPAEREEMNAFFNNYLNPNGAFNIWIDDDGQMHVDEKVDLPNLENVFEFEGDELIDPEVSRSLRQAADYLDPVRVVVPCRLEASAENIGLVNRYISELNEAGI